MIKLLIEQVDIETRSECIVFPSENFSEKHWADTEYVHHHTKYTTLHWLSYHNDFQSINFIIKHIHKNSQNRRRSFIKMMQRTRFRRLTPMCIGGSRESKESMLEFINFFQEPENKEILLDILPKSKDHGTPEGSS
jgi:hypothetical protein